jgi:hypothetical protein
MTTTVIVTLAPGPATDVGLQKTNLGREVSWTGLGEEVICTCEKTNRAFFQLSISLALIRVTRSQSYDFELQHQRGENLQWN